MRRIQVVGNLDDSPGDNTPRERFRTYLQGSVSEVGQIRDYIEECLRTSGDQYAKALQDLVNHLGRFLGFEVMFGRYQGVQGKIGFDGHWTSRTGFHVVVEVKTTEVYAIKTATLLNYINELISEKSIPDPDSALGLYVVGKLDPELRQLENAILAERKTQQLRIVSVNALISLAEMMNGYDVAHEDVLALLRPSAPTIDPVVDLMGRLVAVSGGIVTPKPEPVVSVPPLSPRPTAAKPVLFDTGVVFWLTPVKGGADCSAEEVIQRLVGREHVYAFGENTPGRKKIKPGDQICFYANGKGVIAHAEVASSPERKPHKAVHDPERFPWTFRLSKPSLYLDKPVVIDADQRSRLKAFEGRDAGKAWAWFVQGTGTIDEQDFRLLTRTELRIGAKAGR
jgi:hypothetical protein